MFSFIAPFSLSSVVFSGIQVASTGPGIVRPGENLRLVCKVTGFSIATQRIAWEWIRQSPEKGLEWVGGIRPSGGEKAYNPSLQSRATISSDSSMNQLSLQLNSVTAADSAVYSCARNPTVRKGRLELHLKEERQFLLSFCVYNSQVECRGGSLRC